MPSSQTGRNHGWNARPGIVVAVVGAVLLYYGLNASHSVVDQASQAFLGRFTRETTAYIVIVIGIAAPRGPRPASLQRVIARPQSGRGDPEQ